LGDKFRRDKCASQKVIDIIEGLYKYMPIRVGYEQIEMSFLNY